jgi:FtsP/CotA-like multicopper oxidase with cupredoxin domain
MVVTRRAFVGVGVAVGASYLAARGVARLAGAPLRARAQSAGRDARLASVDGRLDVELVASDDWVDLADGRARLWSFNGQVPGPLLEAAAGDEVRIRLINNLGESTNLHFHGLHVPPTGTADNIFLEVPPGEVASYGFRIPEQHPAGLFWLHPHLHGSVDRQV